MKKAVILTFVLALLLSLSAFATETRTTVMGNNNMIMMDDANVWLFPSRINNYGNLATSEFSQVPRLIGEFDGEPLYDSSSTYYNLGINWKFGEAKPWVLGTYFSNQGPGIPQFYTGSPLIDLSNGDTTLAGDTIFLGPTLENRSFDLLYGRMLGTLNFGFGFGYNHASLAADTGNFELSFTQYVLSVGLTPQTGAWDIAAEFGFGTFSDVDAAGDDVTKPDGYTDISLRGRYLYKYNQTLTFVPHATVLFGSHGATYPLASYGTTADKQSRTAFEVGGGMNYTPVTNVLAVLDFGFQYDKIKSETSTDTDPGAGVTIASSEDNTTNTYLPYFRLGLEGDVFSWMDVRFGATSNWHKMTVENDIKTWNMDNATYLGVGLNFNRLHLDTYMDPSLVLDGFNFISGSSDAKDLNFRVSALYELF